MRFLALVVLLAGCFSPQIDDGRFACADDQCPSGFTCARCDHHCWRDANHQCPVETPDAAISIDAPPPPPVDASIPDVPITTPDAPPSADAPISMLDAPLPPDAAVEIDAPPGAPDAKPPADAKPKPDASPPPPDAPLPPDAPAPPDAPRPVDAGPQPDAPFCGDGKCQDWLGENCSTCQTDCGGCSALCLVGCVVGTTCRNCPSFCNVCTCDFVCQMDVDSVHCPSDCGL